MPQDGLHLVYAVLSLDLWLVSQPPIMVICVCVLSSFCILSPCFLWLYPPFASYNALQSKNCCCLMLMECCLNVPGNYLKALGNRGQEVGIGMNGL